MCCCLYNFMCVGLRLTLGAILSDGAFLWDHIVSKDKLTPPDMVYFQFIDIMLVCAGKLNSQGKNLFMHFRKLCFVTSSPFVVLV